MARAGYRPVAVGVGEREFYVDVESDKSIELEEATKFAQYTDIQLKVSDGEIEVNGLRLKSSHIPSDNKPRYFQILNISTHHPSPDRQYVRVHGVAFETEEELNRYMEWLRRAAERDHRLIGESMDLFSFHEEVGQGLALFHPKGQLIRRELMRYMQEINESMNYQEVFTSHVYRSILWKISGHYDMYRDKMLIFTHEDEELGVKPMNCPGHIMIYKSRQRSYKDLPIRFSEFGTIYRWEKKGELYGLLRVREITQDDGHVFLREDQIQEEVTLLIRKTLEVLEKLGFKGEDVRVNLSTRPDESIGTDEQWEKATNSLVNAMRSMGVEFRVKEKEGAFYGPKIDFEIKDSLERWWQLSTIQVDFNLPDRFKLDYVERDGSKKRPVMVHRAIFGSIDRFMAILLEHFSGKLPTWLSPVQVRVIPISDAVSYYANSIAEKLKKRKVRTEVDGTDETLSRRIKRAYDEGVPYIVVVGRREAEEVTVTVRGRGNVEVRGVSLDKFLAAIEEEVSNRELNPTTLERIR
nr:threonine--tRNA ligase [Sulfodiicoccus acidiphilus]